MNKITLSKMEHKGEARIRVDFSYDATIIQTIKQLKDSRWSQSKKCWHFPYSKEVYALLQQQFEVSIKAAITAPPTSISTISKPVVATKKKEASLVKEIIQVVPEHDFRVKVVVPYHRKDWIGLIKSLPNRAWNKEQQYWSVPKATSVLELLEKLFGDALQVDSDIQWKREVSSSKEHSSKKEIVNEPAKKNTAPISPTQSRTASKAIFQTTQKDGRTIKIVVGQKIVIEQENAEWLRVFVPYDKKGWIEVVKNIVGRKWNMERKYWLVPYVKTALKILKKYVGMASLDIKFLVSPNIPDDFIPPQQYKQKQHKHKRSHFEKLNDIQQGEVLKMVAKLELKRYSIWTQKSYKNHLAGFFLYYKKLAPSTITKEQLSKYLLHLIRFKKISESTQNSIISAVKAYWERVLGRDKEWVDIIRPKKPKKMPNVLSTEEIVEMINVTENLKHKLLLLLIYSAGLRRSEVLKLLKRDINIKRRAIHVKGGKGKKDRYIVLAETVIPYLQDYLKQFRPAKWLFEGQKGGPYSASSLQKIFEKAVELSHANPCATIHTFRHSYATHCLEQGQNVKHVQEALGHSSIKTTEIYLHMTSDALNQLKSPLDNLKIK